MKKILSSFLLLSLISSINTFSQEERKYESHPDIIPPERFQEEDKTVFPWEKYGSHPDTIPADRKKYDSHPDIIPPERIDNPLERLSKQDPETQLDILEEEVEFYKEKLENTKDEQEQEMLKGILMNLKAAVKKIEDGESEEAFEILKATKKIG